MRWSDYFLKTRKFFERWSDTIATGPRFLRSIDTMINQASKTIGRYNRKIGSVSEDRHFQPDSRYFKFVQHFPKKSQHFFVFSSKTPWSFKEIFSYSYSTQHCGHFGTKQPRILFIFGHKIMKTERTLVIAVHELQKQMCAAIFNVSIKRYNRTFQQSKRSRDTLFRSENGAKESIDQKVGALKRPIQSIDTKVGTQNQRSQSVD
jgi:hypothetical protein